MGIPSRNQHLANEHPTPRGQSGMTRREDAPLWASRRGFDSCPRNFSALPRTLGEDNPPVNEPWFPRRSETRPSKTPHLHVRTLEGLLGEAVAITGNASVHSATHPNPERRFATSRRRSPLGPSEGSPANPRSERSCPS